MASISILSSLSAILRFLLSVKVIVVGKSSSSTPATLLYQAVTVIVVTYYSLYYWVDRERSKRGKQGETVERKSLHASQE